MITIDSIIIGIGFLLIQLFASQIISKTKLSTSRWLSLCGGVAIAYVFVYILPTLHDEQNKLGGEAPLGSELYVLGLLGLLVYFTIYKLADYRKDEEHGATRFYFVEAGFFAAYTFMVTYIVVSSDVKTVEALFYGTAIGLHFIGISYNLSLENKPLHLRYGRFILAAATIGGCAAGVFGPSTGLYVDSMIAFTSGAMIFNVISKEMPSEKHTHLYIFLGAAVVYAATITILSSILSW
ncbi:hypothetical protein ATL39_2936 [Sinobaca qinghaiensis]|uniref:ZIP family zinc transporter n=1 Tax=Sinobaca qinghaiensis TaxID=342944 RepID=A0A419UWK7_9BACL|nr:hypothetical protein [Sinobaca qinghaiensis]RKD69517.1 hypothetical protein ATL39_2936 [Sinobaca qinghaiensis]